jgi:nicotinate phosphoribosyltransferase
MVYKLVEVEGRPVAKRSENKQTQGGRKTAFRAHRPTGTAVEEVVVTGAFDDSRLGDGDRLLQQPLVRGGSVVEGLPSLQDGRDRLERALHSVPWEGLKLSRGEPAIPTRVVRADEVREAGAQR